MNNYFELDKHTYNNLIINDEKLTRDRCRIQLNKRLFTGIPQLKGCEVNPEKELEILSKQLDKEKITYE